MLASTIISGSADPLLVLLHCHCLRRICLHCCHGIRCALKHKGKDAKSIDKYFDARRQAKLEKLVSASVRTYQ